VTIAPDTLPDDPAALKRIIAAMAQDAVAAEALIAKLKVQLARYRRTAFGRSSEKLAREAEQLELAIESLQTDRAERLATASPAVAAALETAAATPKPARRRLPEDLPREDVRHAAPCTCPTCGGALRRIGEEVTETLDYVPGRFKVIRHLREKLSCRACDTVVAAPTPDHAIARGRAGAGLLAHILVSKYDDHLPLYRQAEIFARDGVSLQTSTLSGWVGATAAALKPLVDACASSRANPSSPRPSATCGRAGPRWCAASTTAAWLSTTIPPNARCAALPLAARITCSPAPMLAAAAPPQSIR
jgi:transposase